MWTTESRSSVGDYGAGQALTDEQYALIAPALPPAKRGGRPRTTELRRALDAPFYLARTGCRWRHLPPPPPPRFPPWPTVYGYLRSFIDAGVWERAFTITRSWPCARPRAARQARRWAAWTASQSVRTTEKGGPAAMTPPRR
jgi:putative transposase